MKIADEKQPHSNVEIVKKCPKCGEEYAQSFTPRAAADWREIDKVVGEDGTCPNCRIKYSFAGIPNIEPLTINSALGTITFTINETRCGKTECKKDCCGKPNYSDHCMRGMFCVHCGRAFCIMDAAAFQMVNKRGKK